VGGAPEISAPKARTGKHEDMKTVKHVKGVSRPFDPASPWGWRMSSRDGEHQESPSDTIQAQP